MIRNYVFKGVAVGTNAANQMLQSIPVHGLCQIRATFITTAIVGAPSIVYGLWNADSQLENAYASAGALTQVKDNAGNLMSTAAVTAAGTVELSTKWPADCRDGVFLTALNSVAATSATVDMIVTVAEMI